MAKSDLTFRIIGKDVSGSKALKGVGSTADKVGRGMGSKMGLAFAGIGTAAAAAGAMIAVDFGKQSVSAFMGAQDSQAKFEASLAKNGLGKYGADIDALAKSLSLKTKFDDDATKSGAAVLANFGLTGEQLKKTIPLAQDYAAFTGKDLPTASKTLGKAFLGNTKALKDLGIAYKPTGDKAKDMAAVMDLVNDKVGGFAEKQGKTAAGTADILSNQFGEVQETIGGYLVPALTKLGQWIITYVIPAVQTLVAWLGEHLGPVFTAVGGWIMDTLVPAIKTLADGFMTNVWPAIQMVAAMIAENLQPVVAALAEFWTNTLWPAIQRLVPVFATVAKVVGVVVAALAVAISWIASKVVPVFYNVLSPAIGFVVTVFEKVAGAIEWVIENFGTFIEFAKGIPGMIGDAFKTLVNVITWPFRTAFNAIANLWNSTVGNLSVSTPDIPGTDWGGISFSMPKIPTVSAFAKGGIITGPTLALMGERGTETVLPYDVRKGGAGGVHLHVHGPVVGPGAGRWLADEIAKAKGNGRGGRAA